MSRGMLKLYKIIFVSVLIASFFASCTAENKTNANSIVKKKIIHSEKKHTKNTEVIKKTSKKILHKKIIKKIKKVTKTNKPTFIHSTVLNKNHLDDFKFNVIKKGKLNNNTLLVVGGIQGDEPGGFMAASLMSTHYKILKGSVWIVPNLNFYSIIKRSRGPFGDMNRKFAYLPKDDPEYEIVQRIKKYITNPHVKLIVNLHDGSGFYRPMYIDKNHQPKKWGQAVIIDQEILFNVEKYKDIYTISTKVTKHLNKHLLKKEDMYRTKNTHTRFQETSEEKEMAKSLTYYAINNGKAAFGHETSKSLTVPQRVYYKLLAIEEFMNVMGIKYERNFKMSVKGIKKALYDNVSIKFDDTNINMPLKGIRNHQKYFPINNDGIIKYLPSNPLIKIIKQNNIYTIYYGNNRLTKLEADYAEHLNFNTKVDFIIDGKKIKVKFGDTVKVNKSFTVVNTKRFRVNVIGYKHKSGIETNHIIKKNMFLKRYSIERNGKLYRVEFYKRNKFAGMILVKFK